MGEVERSEFLSFYESQKSELHFDNRRVLEKYCQDDVTVLRQACRMSKHDFMHIGYIELFHESITIAAACSKVLRKRFLQRVTIFLIPTVGYTCNKKYSKKALMWLLHMQQKDCVKILHAHSRRDCRMPELPRFSVDGYCSAVSNFCEFLVANFTAVSCSRSVTSQPCEVMY